MRSQSPVGALRTALAGAGRPRGTAECRPVNERRCTEPQRAVLAFVAMDDEVRGPAKFFHACNTGRPEVVARLLAEGVDTDSRDHDGLTGLIWAARTGQTAVADLLLRHGATLETADCRGRTALFHAVAGEQHAFVRFIGERGANASCLDADGWSPLDLARSKRDKEMVHLLEGLGARSSRIPPPDERRGQAAKGVLAGIGIRFYGAEARRTRFGKLVTAAARLVGTGEAGGPAVGICFHLPGEYGAPRFEHGKVASYRREQRVVFIDIPVRSEVLDSDEALRGLVLALRGANALAFEFFKGKGEDFDLRAAENEVSALEKKLRTSQEGR